MSNAWRTESVRFDDLYSTNSWESRIPYFGKMVRQRLIEREEYALEFAGPLEGKRILDLGCGVGRFAVRAACEGAIIHGYDISAAAIEIARAKAKEMGVEDRCTFVEADLVAVDYPEADVWYDLGCLQYIADIAPILARLEHVPRFFSTLPRRGHPFNIPRILYRRLIKGSTYYTYTTEEIRRLYSAWGDVRIEEHGLAVNIKSPT